MTNLVCLRSYYKIVYMKISSTQPQLMIYLGLVAFLLLLLGACTPPVTQYRLFSLDRGIQPQTSPETYARVNYANEDYLPDTLHPEYTPTRYLMVSFHFMNTRDTFYKLYEGEAATEYVQGLLHSANNDLKNNAPNQLSPEGMATPPVYPVNYHMRLAKKPGTEDLAIYHHYDDDLYDFTFRGRNRNLGSRTPIQQYGVELESVLNIFVMPPNVDSLNTKDFKPNELTGVFLGNSIKLAGLFPEKLKPWVHRGNLNHEVGHALGLNHAWRSGDGCDDTRIHKNECWSREQSAHCDTMTSNNVMDYNAKQWAWTPCQIGRIHARLSDLKSKQRKWLLPSWCWPVYDQDIVIEDDIQWAGERDLRFDIQIKAGGKLYLNGRLHLARGCRIIVDPGGQLVLGPNARIHNACDHNWGGIEIGERGGEAGSVSIDPAATLENLAP